MKEVRYTASFIGSLLFIFVIIAIVWYCLADVDMTFAQRSPFINISLVILMCFLLMLILRYLFLLWFGYWVHLQSLSAKKYYEDIFPSVSVIIPAYNEEKVIKSAILSAYNQDYPVKEIVLVDDGSQDRTLEVANSIKRQFSSINLLVLNQPNRGKANALNLGIRAASSDLVLCMHADSTLTKRTIFSMVQHFRDPDISSVAGNVKIKNRYNLLANLQSLEYIEGLNMTRKTQGFFLLVNIIPGPVGMFRRKVVLDIGGYEDDTFAEDCDLTLKLLHFNHKIAYEPNGIVFTEAPERIQELIKQRYRWTRGILQSLKKRKEDLIHPFRNFTTFSTLWYMIFEGLLWPAMNIFANVLLVGINVVYGEIGFLLFWFVLLTILDMVAAFYCVTMEGESIFLVPLAVVYRLFFILVIDIVKLFATIEEILGIRMSWGKLKRMGN